MSTDPGRHRQSRRGGTVAVAAVELAAAAPAAEALVVGREEQVAAVAAAANPANAAEGRSAVADLPSGPPPRRLPQPLAGLITFMK
jgi:hypothetical protein